RPVAYRAPSFSVTPATPWAFEALAERGILMDSSVFPTTRADGGFPGAPIDPYEVPTPHGVVQEFPLTVLPILGRRVPVSGGGYLRAFPSGVFPWAFRRLAAAGRPGVLYVHPRDIDPDQPSPPMPWRRKVKSYVGLRGSEGKIRALLSAFPFGTLGESLRRFQHDRSGA
ncbi:MAG: DUF3473 domain-containing protein, partial [Methanobacteriota archaeon]